MHFLFFIIYFSWLLLNLTFIFYFLFLNHEIIYIKQKNIYFLKFYLFDLILFKI